jgi:hypothetical protein
MSAVGMVLLVCLGVRIAAWLIGPTLPILIVLGVVFAVATGLVRRQ